MEDAGVKITEKSKTKGLKNPFVWLFMENPLYVAAFLLPAALLFVAYLLFGVYPAGEYSVLSLDLNGQYVYYYEYMHDVFRGTESIFYSWSRNLSGEFLGIFGYYLASPFNLIVWLFPRTLITEGLLTMLLVKVGAIGVCMAIYLRRGRGLSVGTSLVFSMMYALCSFVITQTMNPMWLDGVLALPLIIYGVESLVRYGRFRLLILSLVYSFVTCFYIGYMTGIFTALYFIYYLVSCSSAEKAGISGITARIGLFTISATTAVLSSSFMLIPVYSSLGLGKTTFSDPFNNPHNPNFIEQTNFTLIELGRKFFPNSYDTVRVEGLPAIYCGILAVLLIPLFFFAGKDKIISVKKRAAGAILMLVLVLCMHCAPSDTIMHGGQIPNWLPYRYSFILSFLLVTWSAEVFDKIREFPRRAIGAAAAVFLALAVYLESTDTFSAELGKDGRELFDSATVILPTILILTVITAILICNKNKRFSKTALSITIGIIVAGELLFNAYFSIEKQHIDITYSTRDSYTEYILPLREKVNEIKREDEGFYRMEKTFHRTVNDPMALGMYGFSHSSSTLNKRPIALLGSLGMTSKGHYTRYSGATPLINDLFGVRYVLSHDSYRYGSPISEGIIGVKHNENAMPLAYLTDTIVTQLQLEDFPGDADDVFVRQNRLLSAMLGERHVNSYFTHIDSADIIRTEEGVNVGSTTDGHMAFYAHSEASVAAGNSKIIFNMTAEADGEIFMWLPTKYESRLNVWVNRKNEYGEVLKNEWVGNVFEYDDYCVVNLGEFTQDEMFSVTLTLTKNDVYFKNAYFAYINTELYDTALARLREMNVDTTAERVSPTVIRVETFTNTERLLFTTIPFEPGWSVTIDGNKSEHTNVLDGTLIGVIIPPGAHVIEFKYTPAGYPSALYLTGGGVLIFILLCVLYARFKKESGLLACEPYPEELYDTELTIGGGDLTIDDGQLTIDGELTIDDGQLTIEKYDADEIIDDKPEDTQQEQGEIILGSEENFSDIINDFKEINEQPADEPEVAAESEATAEPTDEPLPKPALTFEEDFDELLKKDNNYVLPFNEFFEEDKEEEGEPSADEPPKHEPAPPQMPFGYGGTL